MKKLFSRILLISLPIIILLSIYAKYGEWYYNLTEYPMWISKIEYVASKHNEKDLKVILGDSRAFAGLIPNEIDSNLYNLSLGGGSPMEGYYQLKRLIDQGNTISKLIISYSPYHFEYHESFFERTIKYPFLNSSELEEAINYSASMNNKFWEYGNKPYSSSYEKFTMNYEIKSAYYKLFYNYVNEFRQSLMIPRIFKNREVYQKVTNQQGHLTFGSENICEALNLEAVSNKPFDKNKVLEAYFSKILQLAAERNIRVYYVSAPFNRISYDHINKGYIESYNRYIDSFAAVYKNFVPLNKLDFYENMYFGDPSHLNLKGEILFSRSIKELINTAESFISLN